ncbi:hypothetical protein SLE2022_134840 [Rubroshorea leprosula]
MCALCPNSEWPLHATGSQKSEEIMEESPSSGEPQISPSTITINNSGEGRKMVRKLNHNAGKRRHRRRLNSLCSSLRSLLPPADHETKKLSITATVSRVVKYIPELQEEVERLLQKKEQLLSRISRQAKQIHQEPSKRNGSVAVTANQPTKNELIIQICTCEEVKTPLSCILLNLEEDGRLQLQNAHSFEPSEGGIFHNLHFQVDSSYILEPEALREQLLSLYKNKEEILVPSS